MPLIMDRITSLNHEGPFLFIKGYEKAHTLEIQKILQVLKSVMDEGREGVVTVDQLYTGKLLACKPNPAKSTWYRCKVVDTNDFKSRGIVKISLMEFGSELSVPIAQLRDLSVFNVPQLHMPSQNREIFVHGIMASRGWIPEVIKRVEAIVMGRDNEFTIEVLFNCKNKDFARIMVNGTNLAEMVKKEGCGEIVSGKEQLQKARTVWAWFAEHEKRQDTSSFKSPSPEFGKSGPSSDNSEMLSPEKPVPIPTNVLNSQHVQPNVFNASGVRSSGYVYGVPPAPPTHIAMHMMPTFTMPAHKDARSPSMLTPTTSHCVNVSHIENGAQAFYVQLTNNQGVMQEMANRMKQLILSPPTMLQEGVVCALRHTDGVSRCLVVSSDPCKIRLVDYGLSANVSYADLFELPPQFIAVGQMAYRFCLSGVLNNPTLYNNPDVTEKFKILTKDRQLLTLKVVAPDGPPTVQYCELLIDGTNVLELLIAEATKPVKYGQKTLETNKKYEVMISYVETKSQKLPWCMYVQSVSELDRIENCTVTLGKYCESTAAPDPSKLQENAPVFAKYSVDDRWYRGMLLKKLDSNKSTVYFVDYGNTEEIPFKDLRLPTRSIVGNMPAQAIQCLLDGVCSNQPASLILDSKFCEKAYILNVVYKLADSNTPNVRLIEKGSIDDLYLNDLLVIECMPKPAYSKLPDLTTPLTIEQPALKVLSTSELNFGEAQIKDSADRHFKRPEKELYSAPKGHATAYFPEAANEKRMDWDDPSNNFFADKINPGNNSNGTSGSNWNNHDQRQRNEASFDEPDRAYLKRGSNSVDEWSSKRPSQSPRKNIGNTGLGSNTSSNQDQYRGGTRDDFGGSNLKERRLSGSSFGDKQPGRESFGQSQNHGSGSNFNERNNNRGQNLKPGSNFGGKQDDWSQSCSQNQETSFSNNSFGTRQDNRGQNHDSRKFSGSNYGDRQQSKGQNYGQSQNEQFSRSGGNRNSDFGGREKSGFRRNDRFGGNQERFGSGPKEGSNQNINRSGYGQGRGDNSSMTQDSFSKNSRGDRNSFDKSQMGSSVTAPMSNDNDDWDSPSTNNGAIKITDLSVKIGEKIKAVIVFFRKPNDFFLQPLTDASKIEEITASVTAELEAGTAQELNEGDVCWAKFSEDNAWYRATVQEKNGDKYKVFFVDYGNTSEVSNSDTRPIKEEQARLPAQSFNCLLRGFDKTKYTKEEVDKFEKSIDVELEVLVAAKYKEKYSVVLFKGTECVNISLGATPESLLPASTILAQNLQVGSTHTEMTISWFGNPEVFALHRSNSCENLRDVIDTKEEKLPRLPVWQPKVGTLVHIGVDHKWLRGKIVAVKDSKCKVELLDYGTIKISSLDGLNALPEEFLVHPRQAIVCALQGVHLEEGKSWPKRGTVPKFDSIFNDSKTFTITVKSIRPDGKLDVTMSRDDGADVNDLLRQHGFAAPLVTDPEPVQAVERAVPGCEWKVYVSYFENHMKFYVNKIADQAKIDDLLNQLQVVESEPLTQVEVGQQILAKSPSDKNWYRCTVLQSTPQVEVFMIDYGDCFNVTEMKELPAQLAAIPPYATCCCVPMAANPKKFEKLQDKFNDELFVDSGVTIVILAVANEYLVVDVKTESSTLIDKYNSDGLGISTMFEGYVSNVITLEAIDVQNSLWTDKISKMEKSLEEAASFPLLENPKLGDHCVAKFEDDVFYRCQITTIDSDKTEVCFYDYGNSAEVTEVRKMPDELLAVQQLSQLVKMVNIPKSEAAEDKLMEMLSDGTIKFKFLSMCATSFPLDVVIFKDGIDIRKLVTPGMNILATEFTPTVLLNPALDLANIAEEMAKSEQHTNEQHPASVEVELSSGDIVKVNDTEIEENANQVSDVEHSEKEEDPSKEANLDEGNLMDCSNPDTDKTTKQEEETVSETVSVEEHQEIDITEITIVTSPVGVDSEEKQDEEAKPSSGEDFVKEEEKVANTPSTATLDEAELKEPPPIKNDKPEGDDQQMQIEPEVENDEQTVSDPPLLAETEELGDVVAPVADDDGVDVSDPPLLTEAEELGDVAAPVADEDGVDMSVSPLLTEGEELGNVAAPMVEEGGVDDAEPAAELTSAEQAKDVPECEDEVALQCPEKLAEPVKEAFENENSGTLQPAEEATVGKVDQGKDELNEDPPSETVESVVEEKAESDMYSPMSPDSDQNPTSPMSPGTEQNPTEDQDSASENGFNMADTLLMDSDINDVQLVVENSSVSEAEGPVAEEFVFRAPLPIAHFEQNDDTSSQHDSDMSLDDLSYHTPTLVYRNVEVGGSDGNQENTKQEETADEEVCTKKVILECDQPQVAVGDDAGDCKGEFSEPMQDEVEGQNS